MTRGPELDGTETWQWRGTIDPEGALAMIEKYGGADLKLTAADDAKGKKALEQLAELGSITVVAGADGKPRRLEVRIDASKAQLAELAKTTGAEAGDSLGALHARVRIELSHWNEPVKVTAPAGAKPIEQLFSGFFGG